MFNPFDFPHNISMYIEMFLKRMENHLCFFQLKYLFYDNYAFCFIVFFFLSNFALNQYQ